MNFADVGEGFLQAADIAGDGAEEPDPRPWIRGSTDGGMGDGNLVGTFQGRGGK